MRAVTIWVEDGELKVRWPYDQALVDWFKECFCADWRSYDKKRKIWSVTMGQRDRLEAFCRDHFGKIVYLGELPPAVEIETYAAELAEIIRDLPPDLLKKTYRMLIFELHPDRGGDPDLARRVVEAFAKF